MTRGPGLLVAGLVALGLVPGLANAVPLETAGMTKCEAEGFGIDVDPKGTNLRSAPRADAPIIGYLAPMVQITKDERTGTTFKILGYKDGWFLITDPSPIDGIKLSPDHAGDGRAWISAKLVGTTLGTPIFRAAPRKDAPSIATMIGDNWGPYTVAVLAVHACSGQYVEVTAQPPRAKPVRGWAFYTCSAQLTTCDRAGTPEP